MRKATAPPTPAGATDCSACPSTSRSKGLKGEEEEEEEEEEGQKWAERKLLNQGL